MGILSESNKSDDSDELYRDNHKTKAMETPQTPQCEQNKVNDDDRERDDSEQMYDVVKTKETGNETERASVSSSSVQSRNENLAAEGADDGDADTVFITV